MPVFHNKVIIMPNLIPGNTSHVVAQAVIYQGGYGGDYGGTRPKYLRYNNLTVFENVFDIVFHIETRLCMMMSNLQFCFLTEVLVVVLLYNDLDHNNMADVS